MRKLNNVHQSVELRAVVKLATTFFREFYLTVLQSEEREVATYTYVSTRMPFGSLLSYQNSSDSYGFTSKQFDPRALGLRVSTVPT